MDEVVSPRWSDQHDIAGGGAFAGEAARCRGVKALALVARKVFEVYRPGGVKAHCGALLLEEGLTEKDIKELHDEGIWQFAEIGLGGLRDPEKVNELVKIARKYGYKIPMHFGRNPSRVL
ncbi:hypothetical protein ACFLWY_03320 [Chloroflexota bacterium]